MHGMSQVHLLSGGAAYGLVARLQDQFLAETGCAVVGRYSAVGAMRDQLLAGEPCDLLILTAALIAQLHVSGHVLEGSARDLGRVRTGLALKAGAPRLDLETADQLKAALLGATGIFFPDPIQATAGIHFMGVLRRLGIDAAVAPRLRPFPNGASAMAEMAKSPEAGLIGCTQITEILYTPGVDLAAPLPQEFELATVYTAALSSRGQRPKEAAALLAMLAGVSSSALRRECGFEEG